MLTLEQLEMHVCMFNTVATDPLMLQHHALNIHSTD